MTRVDLGRRLRVRREMKGLSIRKLAPMVNVSTATISDVERGVVGVTFDVLARWCTALETDISELTSGLWQPAQVA